MKKILALLLIIALGLLPAAMAESWIGEAVDAGRSLSTVISLQGIDALADYALVCNEQEIDGTYGELALLAGENVLFSVFGGKTEDGETTYFSASPFGDKILAFQKGDLTELGQKIAALLQQIGLISEEDLEKANAFMDGFGSGEIFSQINLENIDLTPLLTAVMSLEDCISIVESQEEGVSGEIIVQITPDKAKELLDAIFETLQSSPELSALLQRLGSSTDEIEAKILDKLAGDLVIDVLMDETGAPTYASVTLAAAVNDAVRTFVFEFAMEFGTENESAIVFTGSYSDDGAEAHSLFEASFNDDGATKIVALLVGEADSNNFALTVTIPAAVETETTRQADIFIDIAGASEDSEFAYGVDIASEEMDLGGDAARTIVITLSDAAAQADILALVVEQMTGDALEPVSLNGAVYPADMDTDGLTGLGVELLMNVMSWLDSIGVEIPIDALMGAM